MFTSKKHRQINLGKSYRGSSLAELDFIRPCLNAVKALQAHNARGVESNHVVTSCFQRDRYALLYESVILVV